MKLNELYDTVRWKLFYLRLKPLQVMCFHHVTNQFDSDSMNKGDWKKLSEFQHEILRLQQWGVKFISLESAYTHIKKDFFRYKKYAVVTFDDGYASLKEVIPWLMERKIPATLFINGKYLDGISYRKNSSEKYLSIVDLDEMKQRYRDLLSIQSHGWEHTDALEMSMEQFSETIHRNYLLLNRYNPILFHAYTWGHHDTRTDAVLKDLNIVPVRLSGLLNYNNASYIDRGLTWITDIYN